MSGLCRARSTCTVSNFNNLKNPWADLPKDLPGLAVIEMQNRFYPVR
jgi:hypothetical protein